MTKTQKGSNTIEKSVLNSYTDREDKERQRRDKERNYKMTTKIDREVERERE